MLVHVAVRPLPRGHLVEKRIGLLPVFEKLRSTRLGPLLDRVVVYARPDLR